MWMFTPNAHAVPVRPLHFHNLLKINLDAWFERVNYADSNYLSLSTDIVYNIGLHFNATLISTSEKD